MERSISGSLTRGRTGTLEARDPPGSMKMSKGQSRPLGNMDHPHLCVGFIIETSFLWESQKTQASQGACKGQMASSLSKIKRSDGEKGAHGPFGEGERRGSPSVNRKLPIANDLSIEKFMASINFQFVLGGPLMSFSWNMRLEGVGCHTVKGFAVLGDEQRPLYSHGKKGSCFTPNHW